MRRIIFWLTALLFWTSMVFSTNTNAQSLEYYKHISAPYVEYVSELAIDSEGNVWFVGSYFNEIEFGTYEFDSPWGSRTYIAKMSPTGEFLWAHSPTNTNVSFYRIEIDPNDNIMIVGSNSVDFDADFGAGEHIIEDISASRFIISITSDMEFRWAKQFASAWDSPSHTLGIRNLKFDTAHNCIVTGYFDGVVDFDPDSTENILTSLGVDAEVFVMSLDTAGSLRWVRKFGGGEEIDPISCAVDDSSNIYVLGSFYGVIDFNPPFGPFFGDSELSVYETPQGGEERWLLKLRSTGVFAWVKHVGGSEHGSCLHCLQTDAAGNVYQVGTGITVADYDPGEDTVLISSNGLSVIYVNKLDSLGNFISLTTIDTYGWSGETRVASDEYANVYITGNLEGTIDVIPGPDSLGYATDNSHNNEDLFIVKLDSAGAYLWSGWMPGHEDIIPRTIKVRDGNVWLGSVFGWNVDVDPGPGETMLTGHDGANDHEDILLSKLNACDPSSDMLTIEQCEPYMPPSGNGVLYSSGVHMDTLIDITGCQTVYEIDLTVLDTSVTNHWSTLTSNELAGTYQWINCESNMPILGANSQHYNVIEDGDYAVIVSNGPCTDTSACFTVVNADVQLIEGEPAIHAYMNSYSGIINVQLSEMMDKVQLRIWNKMGQLCGESTYRSLDRFDYQLNLNAGVYFAEIRTESGKTSVFKLFKQ